MINYIKKIKSAEVHLETKNSDIIQIKKEITECQTVLNMSYLKENKIMKSEIIFLSDENLRTKIDLRNKNKILLQKLDETKKVINEFQNKMSITKDKLKVKDSLVTEFNEKLLMKYNVELNDSLNQNDLLKSTINKCINQNNIFKSELKYITESNNVFKKYNTRKK